MRTFCDPFVIAVVQPHEGRFSKLFEKTKLFEKKRAGPQPCSENCVDPLSPKCLDLSLIDGATLLVRARAPPETWTTRRKPFGQSESEVVADLFALVTIFGNECSKLRQLLK
jgi:hypothetical protein